MKMRRTLGFSGIAFLCVTATVVSLSAVGRADEDRAVLAGVQYLKSQASGRGAGESAMIALALLKAEVPPSDPALQGCLARIRTRFTTTLYEPEMGPGPGTYEAAATLMVLTNLDATENRGMIELVAAYLKSRQNANGSWDYSGRTDGDTSISQYAVLGLWEAENAGVDVSPVGLGPRGSVVHVGRRAAAEAGIYHRDEAESPRRLR